MYLVYLLHPSLSFFLYSRQYPDALGAYFGWLREAFGAPRPLPLDAPFRPKRPLGSPFSHPPFGRPLKTSRAPIGRLQHPPRRPSKAPFGREKILRTRHKKSRAPFGRPPSVGAPPHRGVCGAYIYATELCTVLTYSCHQSRSFLKCEKLGPLSRGRNQCAQIVIPCCPGA